MADTTYTELCAELDAGIDFTTLALRFDLHYETVIAIAVQYFMGTDK
jgi:hypothetical protein